MPELIAPSARLHAEWLEARDEWGPGVHEDGFGLRPSDEVDSPEGFAAWVARLSDESDPAKTLEAGRVRCTYRWIIDGDRVLGGIALRHEFNDFVRRVGHIGYGIRPSARRRGLATWALSRMLDEARVVGLDRVLIVCEVDRCGVWPGSPACCDGDGQAGQGGLWVGVGEDHRNGSFPLICERQLPISVIMVETGDPQTPSEVMSSNWIQVSVPGAKNPV